MPPLPRQGTIPLQFHYLESLSLAQGFSLTRAAQASLLQNLLLQVPGPPSLNPLLSLPLSTFYRAT